MIEKLEPHKMLPQWHDDLAAEIDAVSKRYPEVSFAKLSRIAKHFAEWQKQQDFKDLLKSDNTNLVEDQKAEDEQQCQGCFDRDEVFWKGMQHAKEELRKEAIEVEVTETCGIPSLWIKMPDSKQGDKVDLLILKK